MHLCGCWLQQQGGLGTCCPGLPSMQSPAGLRDLREGSPGQAVRRPLLIHQPDEEQSRALGPALCLLSRQLLLRRGPFVDTVVRKSANVHLSGGPPGTP